MEKAPVSSRISIDMFVAKVLTPKTAPVSIANKRKYLPLPMQYMGSKLRIADWIVANIKQRFPNRSVFFDVMAGTGSVAFYAAQEKYDIATNDLQPYSHAVLKSTFLNNKRGLEKILYEIENLRREGALLKAGRDVMQRSLEDEQTFFEQKNLKQTWRAYKKFCEETDRINLPEETRLLKKRANWDLFSRYYSNTYFGVRQCLEIDSLRELAEKMEEPLRTHLIGATVSAMTFAASSTTHLAQYLKPNSFKTAEKLLARRSLSLYDLVTERIINLKNLPPIKKSVVLNTDYRTAIKKLPIDSKWVVYADPPYFKEHYSRYYHVLDTFVLYDFPELTYNPRLGGTTAGRYRENRLDSPFGKKAQAQHAFKELFSLCREKKAALALSYASTSLVSREQILKIANEVGYSGEVLTIQLMHTGQGQSRHNEVTEYLFLFS